MIWLALGLSFSGFAALCLAMEKHRLDLFGRDALVPASMRRLRIGGWLLLAAACALCVVRSGWGLGLVQWLGAMTVAAVVLALGLLPYRPRAIVPAAWAVPVAGALLAWLAG